MDYFQLIEQRHSVREFAARDVDDALVQRLAEAATRGPSAGDLQAYHIYAVRQPQMLRELARIAAYQEFISKASVALVFAALPGESRQKYGRRGRDLYAVQDATIACAFAMLAATALGLGSCWVGAFDEEVLCRLLIAPRGTRPVAILAVAYPTGEI
ncbi:MAG: nitroreductase family protein [Chloroflexi bacterium]|nr:nitroreductase family protein [Chloroflexota bacterium]